MVNYYNPNQVRIETLVMSAECEVGEGKEKKVWELGRCCVALRKSLHCSPAEEVSPSQALLGLPHNNPPQGTWEKCW